MQGTRLGSSDTQRQLVWFITGTSSGFGKQFVSSALARGDRVIATARLGSIMKPDMRALEENSEGRCRLMGLDVTSDEEEIGDVAKRAVDIWGRVDVVVNNAG